MSASTNSGQEHLSGKHILSKYSSSWMESNSVALEPTKSSVWEQTAAGASQITAAFVSLPCVLLCSALWAWGKGQRSYGWSRCQLVTASSRLSRGSRPSWPAPRTTALQHKDTVRGEHLRRGDRHRLHTDATAVTRVRNVPFSWFIHP